jgi:TP901-1 family phage major tail protein
MAVQNGKDMLVKMDMTGDGSFETIAGLRASRLSLNAQTVDVTSLNSQGGWRELLAGAGVKAATISGSGVFRDAATDERARAVFFNGDIPEFQVVVPDFGIMQGRFQISGIEYSGTYNGEATYELTLVSAGALAFTPMAEVVAGGGNPADGGAVAGGGA